jgi:hypothetical protein
MFSRRTNTYRDDGNTRGSEVAFALEFYAFFLLKEHASFGPDAVGVTGL